MRLQASGAARAWSQPTGTGEDGGDPLLHDLRFMALLGAAGIVAARQLDTPSLRLSFILSGALGLVLSLCALEAGLHFISHNPLPYLAGTQTASQYRADRLGWYEPASRLFEEAIRCAPESADAWTNLGLCHWHMAKAARRDKRGDALGRHLREAERCFDRALALQPGDPLLERNLALAKEALCHPP